MKIISTSFESKTKLSSASFPFLILSVGFRNFIIQALGGGSNGWLSGPSWGGSGGVSVGSNLIMVTSGSGLASVISGLRSVTLRVPSIHGVSVPVLPPLPPLPPGGPVLPLLPPVVLITPPVPAW